MELRGVLVTVALIALAGALAGRASAAPASAISPQVVDATVAALVAQHGAGPAARIRAGVRQVAERWWAQDGDAAVFAAFCKENFVADPSVLATAFSRLERVSEEINGRLHEVRRELLTPLDLDTGPVSAVDQLLANLDVGAHLTDDLFATKVAFFALLNFPVHTLADRLAQGAGWDRETWARSRMMDAFIERTPAAVNQEITRALTASDQYIADYNIRMDRLVAPEGKRVFPEGLRLISHWGLRDELASHYGEPDGLVKQRLIAKVMERIVRQEIPAAVIDDADLEWCPQTNAVRPLATAKSTSQGAPDAREADIRYAHWIDNFRALRAEDPYSPTTPTFIARSFDLDKQIPEKEVEAMLVTILASPEVKRVGALISARLGRPLEPFDIWYSGFKSRGGHSEEQLDALVNGRYPTVAAFQADLPNILTKLGFTREKAAWLAAHVVVDPSRGAGHAMGAVRREDKAHLRTRIPAGGMNYKGYNIAVHEFGHNVEQVFSLNGMDHWFLSSVPNTAFTEAFAFTFQTRDLELLGLPAEDSAKAENRTLGSLWAAYEIGGVSLVDLYAWRFLYAHPDATPAELRVAVLAAAHEVWNRFFAPVLGGRDCELLAIYSHMITNPLYLSNYAIAYVIEFQLREKLRGSEFGAEFERMARQGRLTPDAWMRGAVGSPISPEALLAAAASRWQPRSSGAEPGNLSWVRRERAEMPMMVGERRGEDRSRTG